MQENILIIHPRDNAAVALRIIGSGEQVSAKGMERFPALEEIPAARRILSEINSQPRIPFPWNQLLVAMECGGSDAMSGVTANVALGAVSALPVIKVASNTRIYQAMKEDMDVNAGSLVEGRPLDQLQAEMLDLMIRVINGEKTKTEINGMEVLTFMTVHPPF